MAVGKGSMERAARAVAEKKPAVDKKTEDRPKTKEPDGKIIYQKSAGMLERAAEPNERFGVGDAMPFYYF